ncbi:tail fiber protein [Roseovarius aestuariivivens]|uniref:tail fiber protein n=1 Tax=Roseovarius aestuariivivens TaxID=1888910 RepID=UPI00108111A6
MKNFNRKFVGAALAAFLSIGPPSEADTIDLGHTGGGQGFSTDQPALKLTPLIQTSGPFDDLGMIRWFASNFVPRGFERAAGQLMSIAQNNALFARIGTTYGGDGRTTFGLPNLIGRTVVGTGGSFTLGQQVGSQNVTLSQNNLPAHSHTTSTGTSSETGGGQAYQNMMPGLALDFELVELGIFPNSSGSGSGAPEDTVAFVTIDSAADGDGVTGFDKLGYRSATGDLVQISQNSSLFSLLGTTYGGDGRTTFAEPDMRDRIVTGTGSGSGLQTRQLGSTRGVNSETLTLAEMPAHTHSDPAGGTTGTAGGFQPENNLQQELSLNWLIALEGLFPSRGPGGTGSFGTPFLGEVALFAGNFAPRGWAFAHGQILQINQNQSLFALLGTMYGGDGRTTFALPDLRGRTPVGGLSNEIGMRFGAESFVLTTANLPSHNHTVERQVGGAIPLPASVWMLLVAIGGLGTLRRRGA